MAVPRQLHHEGFEGWEHTLAGYVTGYVLFAVCSGCLAYVVARTSRPYDATQKLFVLFLVAQGVSFLSGGIAHHMLDIYANNGEVMGNTWSDSNSGWMYPWILAVALAPLASGSMLAMVFIFSKFPRWIAFVTLGTSILSAGFEIAVFIREDLDASGMASTLRAVSASGVSLLILLVGMLGRCVDLSKKAAFWSPEASVGARPLFVGVFFASIAWAILIGAPASCSKVGNAHTGCPFPEAFNQNAVLHTFLMIATTLFCWGVRLRTLSSPTAREADIEQGKPPTAAEGDAEGGLKLPGASKLEGNAEDSQPTLLGNEEATSPKSPKPVQIVPELGAGKEAEEQAENTEQSADKKPEEEPVGNAEPKQPTEEVQLAVPMDATEEVQLVVPMDATSRADEVAPKNGCVFCSA